MYTIVQLESWKIIEQLKADWTTKVLNFLIGPLNCDWTQGAETRIYNPWPGCTLNF